MEPTSKEWKKGDRCWVNSAADDPEEPTEVEVDVGGHNIHVKLPDGHVYFRAPHMVYETEREARLARLRTRVKVAQDLESTAKRNLESAQKDIVFWGQKLAEFEQKAE